jgi:hypothetical protein
MTNESDPDAKAAELRAEHLVLGREDVASHAG